MTSLSGCSIRATRWGKVTVMGANAQTTVQKFLSGAVLTAEQQNTSAATGVPVFASTVTRDAAFGGANKVLAEGQTCYLEDANVVQYYDGAAWATVGPTAAAKVLQVLSTAKLDIYSASGAFANITGLSVAITPSSVSSKILIMASVTGAGGGAAMGGFKLRLTGGNSANYIGDAAGVRQRVAGAAQGGVTGEHGAVATIVYLDSPATTAAITYQVQGQGMTTSETMFLNRAVVDTDNTTQWRGASSITVMEISG